MWALLATSLLSFVAAGVDTTASRVYGQMGNFTTSTTPVSPNPDSLFQPVGVFAVRNGVYVVDRLAHRVLFYPGTSTTPNRVYGQGLHPRCFFFLLSHTRLSEGGSFTIGNSNTGGVSADSLFGPFGVSADATGVYIADASNNRVLFYSGNSTIILRIFRPRKKKKFFYVMVCARPRLLPRCRLPC